MTFPPKTSRVNESTLGTKWTSPPLEIQNTCVCIVSGGASAGIQTAEFRAPWQWSFRGPLPH